LKTGTPQVVMVPFPFKVLQLLVKEYQVILEGNNEEEEV
jgi:hypothetical protein